ncbi:MAG: hypothetical protein ABI811_17785 [Acidobacteriota bacterium]
MKPILASLALLACLTGLLAAQVARDLVEFTLFKRPEPTKVGDISLVLKGTDTSKQRYNIEITVDGHKIEKKDQDIRIPIFLYIGADTLPHEIVVTKVTQDQIVGRLLSPLH